MRQGAGPPGSGMSPLARKPRRSYAARLRSLVAQVGGHAVAVAALEHRRHEAAPAVVEYVGWFNHTRLHEALGDVPPAEMEALYAPRTETNTSHEIKRGSQLTRSP